MKQPVDEPLNLKYDLALSLHCVTLPVFALAANHDWLM